MSISIPTAEQIAEMTVLAAQDGAPLRADAQSRAAVPFQLRRLRPPCARKMREALALIRARAPDLEVDGEMHADAALSEALRARLVSSSPLTGSANLLVMPTLDAANIALTLLSAATEALLVGPMLLGMSKPMHVMVPSVTARGIVNMTALAVAQADRDRGAETGQVEHEKTPMEVLDLKAMADQAVAFHRQGDLTRAEALYVQILNAEPGLFGPHYYMGALRLQQGRFDEAWPFCAGAGNFARRYRRADELWHGAARGGQAGRGTRGIRRVLAMHTRSGGSAL